MTPLFQSLKNTENLTFNLSSKKLTRALLKNTDLVLISTDHSTYDYDWLAENANLIVDTRNAVNKKKKYAGKTFDA